jgi:sarcosine oxidase, subunit gamma
MTQLIQRRSPVHDVLEELHPKWGQVQGMSVALSFESSEIERSRRTELALCDLSCLPRISFKGPGAAGWLEQLGIRVPATVYEYSIWNDDGLIVRTDRQEVLLEDGPAGKAVVQILRKHGGGHPGVYRVERQEAAFLLCGAKANDVLAETCGYDFRQPGSRLIMTRVAGVSCAVLPIEAAGISTFHLWLDCSYGVYLWEALYEIVRDHGGEAVGLSCIFPGLLAKG